jgi:uncharacterized alpha-E superfamily protein
LLLTYGELAPAEIEVFEKNSPKVLEYLILDRNNVSSAYNHIRQSRENARAIQDHITKELWQCLNDFYHFIRDPIFLKQFKTDDPVTSIDMLIKHGLLFTGTLKNTMTRGESYTYLHVGKFLERAILITDILKMNLQSFKSGKEASGESPPLRYLLYSLLGFEIYMKTYKGNFDPQHVLNMVVCNPFFPHSLVYSLYQLNKYFERLKADSLAESYNELEFVIGKTMTAVKYSHLNIENLDSLATFLSHTRQQLLTVANGFGTYYFGNT